MTRLVMTLAICLGSMVILSDQVSAADYGAARVSSETRTAYFQPHPGGVLDVVTSPFRALTTPVNYNNGYQHRAYNPGYGQSNYGSTNCVNGNCTTGIRYQSPCANGQCGTGVGCSTGNCSTGNCPGGNCGVRYLAPAQNYTGYRGSNWNQVQQAPVYHPVSQPVYQTYRAAPARSILNDPFFP
ncbi:hypothetical protein [uncultured Gimesia sp.]|jgi:hypothetical protein|uniref:hypothetical protein n=1 Tax=uncultured Gimesia sp. TaxID=1678688 RepID=UPI002610E337|nr:hypothetical protein [uncultured Gimesia sp.]